MAFQWPRSAALLYNPTIRGHGRKVSGLARVAASRYQASACGSRGGRWSFSLTQTKGLLSAIAGTAARQSTAHIPIAIIRITDPASSRVELRRSPGRGGVARGYLLPNWENEDRGRHQFADRGSSRISQAFHPAYTTLHLKEASSFRRRAREKRLRSCRLERRRLDSSQVPLDNYAQPTHSSFQAHSSPEHNLDWKHNWYTPPPIPFPWPHKYRVYPTRSVLAGSPN
ncbi:Uncharacterised protein [Pseudomonas aeruginosa]|nr:hypothetical protein PALA4_05769 [Pseudomonas aeruginosa]WBI59024.1 hypothetical protein PALA30_05793 [Pseudomonas aeruginosa]SUD06021.1 Uncharacterised protein [Pseudomonas aeruginosa]